jgi:CBS domain-containing protein
MILCATRTTLADARELLVETESAQLFVVGADGTFLGLTTARDVFAHSTLKIQA